MSDATEVKSNIFDRLKGKLIEYKAEFHKITWPKSVDLAKQTITTIFVSLFFGVVIFALDTLYGIGYRFISQFFGNL
jgi:preprotein translocase SecE subunit